MKKPPADTPAGLLISELRPGQLYRCRLSHRAVLVVEEAHTGPMEGDPQRQSTVMRKRGYVYNAVYGVCQWCELVDRQLVSFDTVQTNPK
jgi:hypothetical protein